MGDSINDKVIAGEEIIGVMEGRVREGTAKSGKKWGHYEVSVDGGTECYAAFGDKGFDICDALFGKKVEFVANGRFVNPKEIKGGTDLKPIKTASVGHGGTAVKMQPAQEVGQDTWDRKDREKNRGIAISYAKDLCVAGIIELDAIRAKAEEFAEFISGSPTVATKEERDDADLDDTSWMDNKGKKYPDGRNYGEEMLMSATEAQAKALLKAVRPLCIGTDGEANLSMGVDILNGMMCRFYFDDEPSSLDIKGEISAGSVTQALMKEDALTVEFFIKDMESKQ